MLIQAKGTACAKAVIEGKMAKRMVLSLICYEKRKTEGEEPDLLWRSVALAGFYRSHQEIFVFTLRELRAFLLSVNLERTWSDLLFQNVFAAKVRILFLARMGSGQCVEGVQNGCPRTGQEVYLIQMKNDDGLLA